MVTSCISSIKVTRIFLVEYNHDWCYKMLQVLREVQNSLGDGSDLPEQAYNNLPGYKSFLKETKLLCDRVKAAQDDVLSLKGEDERRFLDVNGAGTA